MNPVVNGDLAPIDPKPSEILTYLTQRHAGQVTADPYFNRPARRLISLHKRQVDLHDSFAEAFDFGHRHSEVSASSSNLTRASGCEAGFRWVMAAGVVSTSELMAPSEFSLARVRLVVRRRQRDLRDLRFGAAKGLYRVHLG